MDDYQFICRIVLPILAFLVIGLGAMALGAEIAATFIINGGMCLVFAANLFWTSRR